MRHSLLTLTLALIALSISSQQAVAAAPQVVTPDPVEFAPALAGDSVLYGTLTRDAFFIPNEVQLWSGKPGAPAADLKRYPAGNFPRHYELAGSPELSATYGNEWNGCGYGSCFGSAEVRTALNGENAVAVSTCTPAPARVTSLANWGGYVQPLLAVSGTRAAYPFGRRGSRGECVYDSRIRIVDSRKPAAHLDIEGSAKRLAGLAMDGNYLADLRAPTRTRIGIRVFKVSTGKLVSSRTFRVKADSSFSFDVDDKGTVAFNAMHLRRAPGKARPLCRHRRELVIARLKGKPRCLNFRPSTNEVKLADNQLAAYAITKSGSQLKTFDLASKKKRVIRTTGIAAREPFDFDGRRMTWAEMGCINNSVVVADLNDRVGANDVHCPLTIAQPGVSLGDFGGILMDISCPNGCTGHWALSATSANGRTTAFPSGPEVTFTGGDFFTAQPSQSATRRWLSFYSKTSDALRARAPERIQLKWTSYAGSIDGLTQDRYFWIDVNAK